LLENNKKVILIYNSKHNFKSIFVSFELNWAIELTIAFEFFNTRMQMCIFWKCHKKVFKLLKILFIRLDLGQASVGA